ncbi:MAG: right-handed parallel beta-helix repeat-containing protein [Methylococcales bacterium]|nr:right-handed parallel beta-helix repeat-containing protein [Methylococcales bacterium]
MNRKLLITIFALSISSIVSAQEFYVSNKGVGEQCSSTQPCASIQTAINLAKTGDSVSIQAGTYQENLNIPANKEGLILKGSGKLNTIITSSGGIEGVEAPAGVPADIIIDVFAKKVTIKDLTVLHGEGDVSKHDIGIFVRPPADNAILMQLNVERLRQSNAQTPPPPAIGILVMRAMRAVIKNNEFLGGYDDNIHIPTSKALIYKNKIMNANLHGIIIVQEPTPENGTPPLSTNNVILDNLIMNSGKEGIEVQGDDNLISNNKLFNNAESGITTCGENSSTCNFPRGQAAVASNTSVFGNSFSNNKKIGVDEGENTFIRGNIILR